MKKEQDYIQDITEIRSMMERSSKFLSLSGWAGIMAGIYALLGGYIAYTFLNFHPDELFYSSSGSSSFSLPEVVLLAITILILSLIHISEPTRRTPISYAVFCLKKKK